MRFEGGGLLGGLSGRGRPSHNGLLAQEASVMTLWEILCLHASPYKAVVWFLWEHPQGVGGGCPREGEAVVVKLLKQQQPST